MQRWTKSAISSPLDLPSDLHAAVYALRPRLLNSACHAIIHLRSSPLTPTPAEPLPRHLDQVLAAEVRPQIYDLPYSQRDQHTHSPKREPLDPLVRALIRIPQLHLAGP